MGMGVSIGGHDALLIIYNEAKGVLGYALCRIRQVTYVGIDNGPV